MSKMSFQPKRKHRSILPSDESIEEDVIFESQKNKTNKSLLDFTSPKLNRLKNFIKSPVLKSYKYKQFQDNEEDNIFIKDKAQEKIEEKLELSLHKEHSKYTSKLESLNMSITAQVDNSKSETSILSEVYTIPTDSLSTSQAYDSNIMSGRVALDKYNPRSVTSQSINGQSSTLMSATDKNYDHEPKICDKLSQCRPFVKSASSSSLLHLHIFEDSTTAEDKLDGTRNVPSMDVKNGGAKWNATKVDIEMTEIMLQNLDDYIKNKRDQISKDVSQKEEMVDKLISNFTTKSDKSSKKIRREYETMNKNAERSLEKAQTELEQLEYKRLIISQDGIPWGVKAPEYVKSINKKDKNKKSLKESSGYVARFLEVNTQKSASAENVSQLVVNKSNDSDVIKAWSERVKQGKDISSKYILSLEDQQKAPPMSHDENSLSKLSNQFFKKPGSAGNSSALSCDMHITDKNLQFKKSKSNSVSSYTGREAIHEIKENHLDSPRNQSISVTSADDTPKSEDLSMYRMQLLQDEMITMKKEIHDVRSECQRFQCETDNLKLDMNTNSELNSQKMQNAIERVDRLERILDILKQQCQIEFATWKDAFHNLEEKLDYRLTTTRRDLQDNIDACNNSISLVEKRTDQLPFMSTRSGKNDVKIITDHLCNLVVSLIAFIMLLISSGFHLLIRFLNIGATISQNRNTLLIPLIMLAGVVTVCMKWSLFARFQSWMFESFDVTAL